MTLQQQNIEGRVDNIFSLCFKRQVESGEDVGCEQEPKWDSRVNLELIMGIEDARDTSLTTEQLEGLKSKAQIVDEIVVAYGTV